MFIKNPNLPEGRVNTVIIGENHAPELKSSFKKLNIDIITLPDSEDLPFPVRNHADMLINHIGSELLIISQSLGDEEKRLQAAGFRLLTAEKKQGKRYPHDIALNVLIIGGYAFCKFDFTDPILLNALREKNIKIVNVNQGYAKCSVCVLDEYSAITSDISMHTALSLCGIDSLLISQGHIGLTGYDYGFIGGASGKIDKNRLAFTGTLDTHPDKDRILNFIKSKNIEPFFLTDNKCFDIGSIIPIRSADPVIPEIMRHI